MTQTARGLHPPRLAAWLVELFAPAKEAESILGDLQEEFSDLTSRSGVRFARRWYWRQCVKTVFHLAGAAFWSAPRSLASIVFLGFLLQWFSATLPERLVIAILRTQRPYSNQHVEAYIRFMTYGIPVAAVIHAILIGSIVAVLAKGRVVGCHHHIGHLLGGADWLALFPLCALGTAAAGGSCSYVCSFAPGALLNCRGRWRSYRPNLPVKRSKSASSPLTCSAGEFTLEVPNQCFILSSL